MPIEVIDRHPPLVYMRIHGRFHANDVTAMIQAYDVVFRRGERFTSLADMREVEEIPGPDERKALAEWMTRIEPDMERLCLGAENVFRSSLVRGAVTAIYWLVDPPAPPRHQSTTLEDGLDWCVDQLKAAGIDARAARGDLLADVGSRRPR